MSTVLTRAPVLRPPRTAAFRTVASACVVLGLLGLTLSPAASAQTVVTQGDNLFVDYSAARGELVVNLLGDLWALPENGGVARRLVSAERSALRPAWSPDSRQIVFEAGVGGDRQLYLYDVSAEQHSGLPAQPPGSRHPAWHPSGDRLLFAAPNRSATLDLYEYDLRSQLAWKLTDSPADDREPVWSGDGRDLAWVRRTDQRWLLMLRPFGQPDRVLVASEEALAAPAFRPDGTLLTYTRAEGDRFALRMVILSEPPLDRQLATDSVYPARVSWKDRGSFVYSTGRRLLSRTFDDWSGRPIPFRASQEAPQALPTFQVAAKALTTTTPGSGRVVYRAARLFDGASRRYRDAADVVVEDGVIVDVTARRDWPDVPIVDLSPTTLMPGYVDVYGRLPAGNPERSAATLLSWGVTTLVTPEQPDFDPRLWESEATTGPRLLNAGDLVDTETTDDGSVSAFLIVADAAADPAGAAERTRYWQAAGLPVFADELDVAQRLATYLLPGAVRGTALETGPVASAGIGTRVDLTGRQLLSGLADRRTPGIHGLFDLRQAAGARQSLPLAYRIPLLPDLRRARHPVVLASAPNGLPAGLALHAELLALQDAGLPPDMALKAAGRHAATLLGVPGQLGEIAVGARADLVFVNGDPLGNVADASKIVAVVRNGHLHSVVALLDRRDQSVE